MALLHVHSIEGGEAAASQCGGMALVPASDQRRQHAARPGREEAPSLAAMRRKCNEALAALAAIADEREQQRRRAERAVQVQLAEEEEAGEACSSSSASARTSETPQQLLRRRQAEQPNHGSISGGSNAASPDWVLGGAYPASSGAVVSVRQLPQPSAWDTGWDERVACLRTLDLLLLHKQWMQWCAMKLPIAELERNVWSELAGAGPAGSELADMYARYTHFTERVTMLAPEAWQATQAFDLETLSPLPDPPELAYLQGIWAALYPDCIPKFVKVRLPFKEAAARLQAEQARLQRRHDQLQCLLCIATVSDPDTDEASEDGSPVPVAALAVPATAAAAVAERATVVEEPCCAEGAAAREAPLAGSSVAVPPGGEGSAEGTAEATAAAATAVARAELALVRQQLDQTTRQYARLTSETVRAVHYAIPIEQFIKVKLALYPLAMNGHVAVEMRQPDAEWFRLAD